MIGFEGALRRTPLPIYLEEVIDLSLSPNAKAPSSSLLVVYCCYL